MWHTKCVRVRIEERWQTFEMMAWWQLNSRSTLFGGIRVANFRCLMRSKPLVNILLLLSRNSSVIKEKASKTYQLVSSKGMQISDDYRRSLRVSTLILLRTTSRHNQSWPLLHFCSTSCCFLPPYQAFEAGERGKLKRSNIFSLFITGMYARSWFTREEEGKWKSSKGILMPMKTGFLNFASKAKLPQAF